MLSWKNDLVQKFFKSKGVPRLVCKSSHSNTAEEIFEESEFSSHSAEFL